MVVFLDGPHHNMAQLCYLGPTSLQTSYHLSPPPIKRHTIFSIPPPTHDITLHYRRLQVMCHYSIRVQFSPLTRHSSHLICL
jgi:hypothetical protein